MAHPADLLNVSNIMQFVYYNADM